MKQKLMELRSTLILAYLKLCIQRKGQFWLHQSSTIVGSNHFLTHPSGMAYRPNHSPNAFFNHYSPQASAMKIKQRKAPQIPLLPIKKQKRMLNQPGQWVVLVAAIWIQAFAGTNFDFPLILPIWRRLWGCRRWSSTIWRWLPTLARPSGGALASLSYIFLCGWWCSWLLPWGFLAMASNGFSFKGLSICLTLWFVSILTSFLPLILLEKKKKKNKNHNHVDLNWIHF